MLALFQLIGKSTQCVDGQPVQHGEGQSRGVVEPVEQRARTA